METNVIEFEKRYWNAMENHDYNTVRNLTRFPCIVAGRDGIRQVDETEFQKNFESSKGMQLKVLDLYDEKYQKINEETMIIAYMIRMQFTSDGKETPFHCACASTWVKEDNNWLCALHTETDVTRN
ncbi:DUF4440 domain-containing protein [Chryseobacterium flavum]|uniref:DUF4440 domain-containing protein n=1 Tax=Chryseobacterium flavum TaxID=415851 RepID=UPI0028A8F14C|nr:DUF4440 domain-containing protein [Chryseobacterium flavum]